MNKNVERLREKSKRSLNAAKNLHDHGDFDFSVSRAYYSLFYIAEALLLIKGKAFSKHSAVISAVFELYVKTGDLDKRFHQILHRAYDLRQQGDYLAEVPIDSNVSHHLIKETQEFLKETESFFG